MTPQLVRSLARVLSSDSLTVDDVTTHVGPAVDDPGAPLPVVFRPSLAGVADARLWRYPDSGLPYMLRLEPSGGGMLTVADLEAEFGASERLPSDRGRPETIVFPAIARGPAWTIVAIAEIDRSEPSRDPTVTSIALRRDPA